MENQEYRIEMQDIKKAFSGVYALNGAQLRVKPGEIHALIGENGAGKSTLMKVLAGALQRDGGIVKIEGQEVHFSTPKEGKLAGIATIYQEFMLAPELTVTENIFIDRLNQEGKIIKWKRLTKEAERLLSEMGFDEINPGTKVSNLSVAYQQVVEICKSISRNAKVLILDEPTAVLTVKEIQKLFTLLKKLKADGVSIIYISHRLEEIFELCDTITVMKDGAFVDCIPAGSIDKDGLIRKMVGRELNQMFPKRNAEIGDTILEVEHLTGSELVQDISFSVKAGQVLGFYGLVGAGRTETMRAIFGADKWESGNIRFLGKSVHFKSPKQAVRAKLGMLPEDRKRQGVLLEQSIKMNTSITAMEKAQKSGIFNSKKETDFVKGLLAKINTKYASIENPASSLSGGNQQKVALAKWLAADCKCIIFDEPTRGVDVGAKTEIYHCINQLAKAGLAIIMISSEMPELMGMCDDIIVMHQGRIRGTLSRDEFSEDNIIFAAMGGEK
ncbi:MAG: sugar ABC transporter ATP-binding protein [Faecalicatena sp.]|uniref:sugar ABC transporter ATP-binding protein n=1 Tax=Faecalicatena sp. TaxID=2005360 RepID=UPI0025856967|nr:sugar ABC transporter ATP-binding protein [Faecalicatena sp.]MCI6465646.1 sugar ABC transporter ATP-binding protein [Faecalicatena sp.]MDY5618079.1 sugar ABC transporter ATP-binding protein [Lachnospiraceae bacterium]